MTRDDIELQLEGLVDDSSIVIVLECLAQVCIDKARHLEETWQDYINAKHWEGAGQAIADCSQRYDMTCLSRGDVA